MTPDRSPREWSQAVRQQAALAELGQLGLQHRDLEAFLEASMQRVAEVLGVGDAVLFELLSSWRELRGRNAIHEGAPVDRSLIERLRVHAGRESFPGFALEELVPVATVDLLGDARFQAQAPEFGMPVRSAVAAPIEWSGRPFGVFAVYGRAVRSWTTDEIDFVHSVASTMGLAIRRNRMEQELRDSSARLDLSLSAGGLGAWSWDIDADSTRFSPSALRMYGLDEATYSNRGDDFLAIVHPDDRHRIRGDAFEALETSGEQHLQFRIVRATDGELRWIETWGRMVEGEGHRHLVGVCSDVTDRRRAEHLRETMLAREHDARVEAELARERLTFLAEASARLGTSLDTEVTVASLAELCVPYLADVCLVDLMDDQGVLAEVAGTALDPQSLVDVRELRRRRAELGGVGGVWSERSVALQGRSLLHTSLSDDDFRAAAVDDEHLALFRRFGASSSIVGPLVARGRVVGVITLMRNRTARPYGPDDLALAEDLASRAALAVDNGRLFHSRNRVARSLQAALLPPTLPSAPGLGLAARYQVAEADVEIGGDFYDVMEVGERAWGVVVGDVCGRGPDAAAITGLMRHSVRTAVVREALPSRVLAQTNEAVLHQIDDAKFCTAAYLRVEVGEGGDDPVRLTASSAGHPRPALVRADGTAELLACAGTLLGVVAEPTLVDVTATLGPGDAVVLYTDGVTEARQGKDLFGEDRLLEALRAVAGRSAEAIASGLESAVTDYRRSARDDTAILVVQAQPPGWQPVPDPAP